MDKEANLKNRNTLIDSVRGFAILVMIAANSWLDVVPFPSYPLGLRLIFSIAAPLFIFISGVSLNLAEEAGKDTKELLKRVFQVLFIGVLIDTLVLKIVPFYTFDVLYLISFSLLFIIFLRRTSIMIQWLIIVILLSANLFLLNYYEFDLIILTLADNVSGYSLKTAFHQLFLDGWFPIFPWAGIAYMGYMISKYRKNLPRFKIIFLLSGVLLITLSVFLFATSQEELQPLRKGYAELFYPVESLYWLLLIGLILVLVPIIKTKYNKPSFLADIGQMSLFLYLIHIIVIAHLLPLFSQEAATFQWWIAVIIFICFYAFLLAVSFIIRLYTLSLKKGKLNKIGFFLGF